MSKVRWRFNLFIVFLISGLWHGANWTFVIWGALHGTYLVVATLTATRWARIATRVGLNRWPRLWRVVQILVCFHLVTFAWIFFRAATLKDALFIVQHVTEWHGKLSVGLSNPELLLCFLSVVGLGVVEALCRSPNPFVHFRQRPRWVRWSLGYGLAFATLLLGQFTSKQFIYFQF